MSNKNDIETHPPFKLEENGDISALLQFDSQRWTYKVLSSGKLRWNRYRLNNETKEAYFPDDNIFPDEGKVLFFENKDFLECFWLDEYLNKLIFSYKIRRQDILFVFESTVLFKTTSFFKFSPTPKLIYYDQKSENVKIEALGTKIEGIPPGYQVYYNGRIFFTFASSMMINNMSGDYRTIKKELFGDDGEVVYWERAECRSYEFGSEEKHRLNVVLKDCKFDQYYAKEDKIYLTKLRPEHMRLLRL